MYVYCDPETKEVINVTKKPLKKKGYRVEVEVDKYHAVPREKNRWLLNSSGDGIERDTKYRFVNESPDICAIVEVLHSEIKKKISSFPSLDKVKEEIQKRYEVLRG